MLKRPSLQGDRRPRIGILCVDDHRILREGLTGLLSRQPDMRVVGAAGSSEEALQLFRRHRPDVTLMNVQLGAADGIEVIRAMRRLQPDARVIVLTMFRGEEDIHRALDAGAATYLLKDTGFDDLVHAIREVDAGRRPEICASVRARLAERAGRPELTRREVEVLELVRLGLRNRQIATALGVGEETIQSHMKSILSKLDVADRTAAIDVALRRGIIHLRADH